MPPQAPEWPLQRPAREIYGSPLCRYLASFGPTLPAPDAASPTKGWCTERSRSAREFGPSPPRRLPGPIPGPGDPTFSREAKWQRLGSRGGSRGAVARSGGLARIVDASLSLCLSFFLYFYEYLYFNVHIYVLLYLSLSLSLSFSLSLSLFLSHPQSGHAESARRAARLICSRRRRWLLAGAQGRWERGAREGDGADVRARASVRARTHMYAYTTDVRVTSTRQTFTLDVKPYARCRSHIIPVPMCSVHAHTVHTHIPAQKPPCAPV